MKKIIITFLLLFIINSAFGFTVVQAMHSYSPDYSLFPEGPYKEYYIKRLTESYEVKYCFQSVMVIPKEEITGYKCNEILKRLDQMGGVDKECYGVSYVDVNGIRKPIFKKSNYDTEKGELYIKDKAAGGLYFDVQMEQYISNNSTYAVSAVLNKTPSNIFVREIKRKEASIFVLINENNDGVQIYALIQSHFSPLKHKILNSIIESAINARVLAIQEWFARMMSLSR